MGVIPNPKMAFIFPISCILALIFPILMKYFPKCLGKGSFPKSQIKSLQVFAESVLLPDIVITAAEKIVGRQTDKQTNRWMDRNLNCYVKAGVTKMKKFRGKKI